jgi:hypothetical protein
MKATNTRNLLVEDTQSDDSTIAVIKDVDLSDHKTLRDKLTLVLTEHYDADAITTKIPEDIKGSTYPIFSVPYEIEVNGVKWNGEVEICCVCIY